MSTTSMCTTTTAELTASQAARHETLARTLAMGTRWLRESNWFRDGVVSVRQGVGDGWHGGRQRDDLFRCSPSRSRHSGRGRDDVGRGAERGWRGGWLHCRTNCCHGFARHGARSHIARHTGGRRWLSLPSSRDDRVTGRWNPARHRHVCERALLTVIRMDDSSLLLVLQSWPAQIVHRANGNGGPERHVCRRRRHRFRQLGSTRFGRRLDAVHCR